MAMNEPLAQDYTVVWHNPDPEYYVEGSGLLNLGGGEWLGVVPVVPRGPWRHRRAEHSRTHLVRSEDGGAAWSKVSELPYYSAVPFRHEDAVYLFTMKGGTKLRNDDLLLLRSEDGGRSWSEPVTLFKGHLWNCHTSMAVRDNTIYWAVDDLSFGEPYFRGPVVVAGDLSRDLMSPDAWRMSNPVPFPGMPDMIKDPASRGSFGKWLEPNVIKVGERLRVLCAVRKTGICGVLDLEDDGRDARLKFCQYHPMPGGQLKFCVAWDEASQLFWATSNPLANSQELVGWSAYRPDPELVKGGDRRLLMLHYSLDGLNWFPAGCVALAPKLTQSFNYATLAIDGGDLGVIARSNVNGPNPHDADCATFHRVRGFRDLALPIVPEAV